jgi:predicted nuclease with TOPRIM domain
MKVINQLISLVGMLLPFLKRKDAKEMQEFTELVKGQFDYLMEQVTRFETDYFELSEKVRQMYQEIITLNARLSESLKQQCVVPACVERAQTPR